MCYFSSEIYVFSLSSVYCYVPLFILSLDLPNRNIIEAGYTDTHFAKIDVFLKVSEATHQ